MKSRPGSSLNKKERVCSGSMRPLFARNMELEFRSVGFRGGCEITLIGRTRMKSKVNTYNARKSYLRNVSAMMVSIPW